MKSYDKIINKKQDKNEIDFTNCGVSNLNNSNTQITEISIFIY